MTVASLQSQLVSLGCQECLLICEPNHLIALPKVDRALIDRPSGLHRSDATIGCPLHFDRDGTRVAEAELMAAIGYGA